MRPAPAFDCACCARYMGKTTGHSITEDRRVICTRCLSNKRNHAKLWPDCAEVWHDVHDHTPSVCGTRAGVAAALGLWGWGQS